MSPLTDLLHASVYGFGQASFLGGLSYAGGIHAATYGGNGSPLRSQCDQTASGSNMHDGVDGYSLPLCGYARLAARLALRGRIRSRNGCVDSGRVAGLDVIRFRWSSMPE